MQRTRWLYCGGALLIALPFCAGCVQSRASVYQRHLAGIIKPSEKPNREVEIAFGLNDRHVSDASVAAVTE